MTKMEYHVFIDSNENYEVTGADTHSNFYYNIRGFLPDKYEKYYVKADYVIIDHNATANAFYPYNGSRTLNVLINFNKGYNIYDNYTYLVMHSCLTERYDIIPYWNTTTAAVGYYNTMNKPCLYVKDGPELIIDRPDNIINIKIVTDADAIPLDANGGVIPRTRILLRFRPFIECACRK